MDHIFGRIERGMEVKTTSKYNALFGLSFAGKVEMINFFCKDKAYARVQNDKGESHCYFLEWLEPIKPILDYSIAREGEIKYVCERKESY